MSTIWAFYHIENKHPLYHGKDCMKKFCESLREQAKKYTLRVLIFAGSNFRDFREFWSILRN